MRFGKTFAAYQLAKKMKWKKVLVLTFKPAVQSAWQEDLETHIDFDGWQFVAKANALEVKDIDKDRPIVCFGSFQDYLGRNKIGGLKLRMNGYMQRIGMLLFLMNIIMVHGEKMQKIYFNLKMIKKKKRLLKAMLNNLLIKKLDSLILN